MCWRFLLRLECNWPNSRLFKVDVARKVCFTHSYEFSEVGVLRINRFQKMGRKEFRSIPYGNICIPVHWSHGHVRLSELSRGGETRRLGIEHYNIAENAL